MLLSLNWLKDYIKVDENPTKIAAKLSETGTHAESVIEFKGRVKGVKTAKILSVKKHENADKLSVCDVDFGDRKDVIVTAAKNMNEGDIVGVATPGSILADGTKIEPHDFRGIISNGMFVSYEEIGFPKDFISKEDQQGILILPSDTKLGIDLTEAINLDGIVEFEITPNRPDCLSVFGLALESAATFDSNFKEMELFNGDLPKSEIDASVETEKVGAYELAVVKNVEIKESPVWIRTRLMESGVRPINNIIDITNYVMLETGIPMHAFDLDKLNDKNIKVREAKKDESIVLLDGKEVKTEEGDILITSKDEPVALAGIMGLDNSKVTSETKNIVLEGANFDHTQIRRTGKRLDINSEARTRFQKKLDPTMARTAILRALYLLKTLGFEEFEFSEVVKGKKEEKVIKTRHQRINSLIGKEIDVDFAIKKLNRLKVNSRFENGLIVSEIPGFRPDLNIEADIIEEIGRLYCYKNVESVPIKTELTVGYESELKSFTNKIRKQLKYSSYFETLTYSFIGPKLLSKIDYKDEDSFIKILNPLGEEFSVMRPTMNAHFLEVAEKNFKRSNGTLKIFEVGHVFKKGESGEYDQLTNLNILHMGFGDFYDLRNTVVQILDSCGISDYKFVRSSSEFYHPGRSAEVFIGEESIGNFGQVHPNVAANFDLKEVYVAELSVDKLLKYIKKSFIYAPKSKFQEVRKEISFVVEDKVLYGDIKETILNLNSPILRSVYYYDVYKDELLRNKKSITVGLVIGAEDRTLKDSEIKSLMEEAIEAVKKEFGAELR